MTSPPLVTPSQQPQQGVSSVPQKRSHGSPGSPQKTKVTRACDICKAKKSKCSGEQPCTSCNRRGLHCQYEAVYSRGKAPTPRRIEPAGLEHLRSIPDQQRSLSAPSYSHAILSTNLEESPIVHKPMANSRVSIAPRPNGFDCPQDIPSRGSPTLEAAGHYSDSTSGLSFLHRAWKRISNSENSQLLGGHSGSTEDNQLLRCAGDKPLQGTNEVS